MEKEVKPISTFLDVEKDKEYAYFKQIVLDNMADFFEEADWYCKEHIIRSVVLPEDINFDNLKWHIKTVGTYAIDGKCVTMTLNVNKLKVRYYEEETLKNRINSYFEVINNLMPDIMLEEVEIPVLNHDGKEFIIVPFSSSKSIPLWEMRRYFNLIPGFEYKEKQINDEKKLELRVVDKESFGIFYAENFKKFEARQKQY